MRKYNLSKIYDNSFKKDILDIIKQGIPEGAIYSSKVKPPENAQIHRTDRGTEYWIPSKKDKEDMGQTRPRGTMNIRGFEIPKKERDAAAKRLKAKTKARRQAVIEDKKAKPKYGKPEQEFNQDLKDYAKLVESSGSFEQLIEQDRKDMGTKDYKGVAEFWHSDYENPMTVDATMKQRRDVHNQYIKAGLNLEGKSEKHYEIMANVMVAGGRFIKDPKTGNLRGSLRTRNAIYRHQTLGLNLYK